MLTASSSTMLTTGGSSVLTTGRIHICSPINWGGITITIGVVVILANE